MNTNYSFDQEIQKGITQVLTLCYQINCDTPFAAFYDFHGHTNQIDVRLCKGKDVAEFNTNISNNKTVYLSWEDSHKQLAELIAKLSAFLQEHKKSEFLIEL